MDWLDVFAPLRLRSGGVCVVDEVPAEGEAELMNDFTFVLKYNPENNPNELGEALRNEFFNQDTGNYGCYSTFELRDGIEELPQELVDNDLGDYEIKINVFSKLIDGKNVIMKYWWDGDGTLEFHFEDGTYLYNGDCKKDYVWEYIK